MQGPNRVRNMRHNNIALHKKKSFCEKIQMTCSQLAALVGSSGSRPSCSAHRKDFAVHHWALPTCPSQELRKQKRRRRPAGMVHVGLRFNSRNTRDENRTPAIIDLVILNQYRVDCLLRMQISNCIGVLALLLSAFNLNCPCAVAFADGNIMVRGKNLRVSIRSGAQKRKTDFRSARVTC
jgi:hypothetical protein